MKKFLSAVLAGTMCAGMLTACGDKDDDKNSSGLSSKGKSEYASIIPLDGNKNPMLKSLDEGMEYAIDFAEDFDSENGYNPCVVKFSDGKFVYNYSEYLNYGVSYRYYDGKYSIKDEKIKFSYKNAFSPDSDFEVNINDEYEYDPKIVAGLKDDDYVIEISGNEEWLEDLDSDTKDYLISMGSITFGELKKSYKAEYKALRNYHSEKAGPAEAVETMKEMNENGSFSKWAVPSMSLSDKWTDFAMLPFVRWVGAGRDANRELPNTLLSMDDFLCSYTYGIELDGKYKRGKDFTLKHDLEDVMEDDEQSYFYKNEDDFDEERFERMIELIKSQYDCDSLESTIEFSDGKWEWFNDDGELLNNGEYEESKDYPGLIKMSITEDSEKHPEYALNTFPLLLYIADDGEIYYPGYVKMK